MKTKLFDQKGKEVGDIELNKDIFGLEMNEWLVHRALIYQLANNRINIAHTKTRGERRGSTRKIYRQKGTGRARMGANRSPIRRGGWVVFGPRNNTNFTLKMNKQERRKALFCVLSEKLKNKQLVVIKDITLKDVKTKAMVDVFTKLPFDKTALLAISKRDDAVQRSSNNLPYVKTVLSAYLNVKDLMKYNTLVLSETSLDQLNSLVK